MSRDMPLAYNPEGLEGLCPNRLTASFFRQEIQAAAALCIDKQPAAAGDLPTAAAGDLPIEQMTKRCNSGTLTPLPWGHTFAGVKSRQVKHSNIRQF